MAAAYPTSNPSFSTKATNDVIAASHINGLQDEVIALGTALRVSLQHNLLFTDATFDIGASGATRPRDLFLSRLLNVAGGQIVFPSTQVPSTDVNTLDDYEEGIWLPVIGGSGGTSGQTYTTQIGVYIKIGKLVFVQYYVVLSAKGTITAIAQIQGLPFAIENQVGHLSATPVAYWASLGTAQVQLSAIGVVNSTAASLFGATGAVTSLAALSTTDIGNTTSLAGTFVYKAGA
jgi:hypothetical protein